MKQIQQIGDTALSISVYSVEKAPTKIHSRGILEIIFCLKGSVKFSYAYEEFTLHAGEYISVDKDAYYLYDGKDNLCVSFYFDLARYEKKYPFICNNLFVCEGLAETRERHTVLAHNNLKGMMIGLLKYILENGNAGKVEETVGKMVDTFVESFDVIAYYSEDISDKQEDLNNMRYVNDYIYRHLKEKITIADLANEFNFAESYMSEYIRKNALGFRNMLSYVRANASEHYLLNTDKTILEISEECGFSDVKYYYSAFKKWYRCTPKQFRKQYGQMQEEKIWYRDIKDIQPVLNEMLITHYMETFIG